MASLDSKLLISLPGRNLRPGSLRIVIPIVG